LLVLGKKYIFNEIEENILKNLNIQPHYIENIENFSEIKKHITTYTPKFIVLNTDQKPSKELIKYLTYLDLNGVILITIENFLEKYMHKLYIPKDAKKLNFLEEIKPFSKKKYILKRIIDYAISIPLGISSIPIMLYSVYRIKKESPNGPVIFKQKRVGLNGNEFTCYKFRSMVPDAEKEKPQFASKNDPRVFKWGAFMRKTRIDELPQLWNVLKGDMHVIGPRPERKYWIDIFEKNIPYYNLRHLVKPGITGWAQVNYHYGNNEEDAYQKLMYDLFYIKNWSFQLEMKTILKTIAVMLKKKGV